MARTIEENLGIILKALYDLPRDDPHKYGIEGKELHKLTNLTENEINDAVVVLEGNGYVEWMKYSGTYPYVFGNVKITATGRFELENALKEDANEPSSKPVISSPITPVGSPYGFQDEDWESVSLIKSASDKLQVVFGFQWESDFYNRNQLEMNLKKDFQAATNFYNSLPDSISIELNFKGLAAGYGEHLFNEIARDIISADIAVFDTSDLNPNVMLEMGVALTWGVRVLPIKKEGCPVPPSDISGQTWADYTDSGAKFSDPDHSKKLAKMVERAARKKG